MVTIKSATDAPDYKLPSRQANGRILDGIYVSVVVTPRAAKRQVDG